MSIDNGITDLIFNEGTLFDIDIGRWAAVKKLTAREVLLEDLDAKAVHLGHKRLLPKEAMVDLIRLEGKARSLLDTHSLQFPIAGARFVYLRTLHTLIEGLMEIRQRYFTAVAQLVEEYPTHKAHQLERLNKMAEDRYTVELTKFRGMSNYDSKKTELDQWLANEKQANEDKYPDVSSLRSRFRFDWHIFRISQFTGDGTTLSAEEINEAQVKLKSELNNWVRTAVVSMHKALGEAALQAKELMEKHGKLNPRNLRPLFDAFETFKSIDFTGSSDMQGVIDQVRARFGVVKEGEVNYEATAEYINSGGSQGEFTELLNSMSQLAVEDAAQKAGLSAIRRAGRFARVIED